MIKYFRFEWEYVLWGISYANLNMLLATIPVYESETVDGKTGKGKKKEDLVESFEDIESFLN